MLIGDPSLQPNTETFTEISKSPRVTNLIGQTNFVESAHLISQSILIVAMTLGWDTYQQPLALGA